MYIESVRHIAALPVIREYQLGMCLSNTHVSWKSSLADYKGHGTIARRIIELRMVDTYVVIIISN